MALFFITFVCYFVCYFTCLFVCFFIILLSIDSSVLACPPSPIIYLITTETTYNRNIPSWVQIQWEKMLYRYITLNLGKASR